MEYCCKAMGSSIEVFGEFEYDPINNRFIGFVTDRRSQKHGQRVLAYCPFCGTKLPEFSEKKDGLLEEVLCKEFCDIKEEEIPDEFRSDEWWKKRNFTNLDALDTSYDPIRFDENIEIVNGEKMLKINR
jgi:hypothetical protein